MQVISGSLTISWVNVTQSVCTEGEDAPRVRICGDVLDGDEEILGTIDDPAAHHSRLITRGPNGYQRAARCDTCLLRAVREDRKKTVAGICVDIKDRCDTLSARPPAPMEIA